MLYTIGTSNNYPNRAYGAFKSVKGSITDYLMFRNPAPIHLNIRIDFTDFEAIAAKWDCISIDRVYIYLLNKKAMDFFEKHCPGTFEWVPAKIYSNNTLIETEHKLLHITYHAKEGALFYNKDSLRCIWVEEAFMKKYKKEKLKGWTFCPEEC